MKIKLLKSLLIDGCVHPKWSIVEVEDEKGKRLLSEGVADTNVVPIVKHVEAQAYETHEVAPKRKTKRGE